ncbi:MAG TPA: hypothetical protein VFQ45_16620 [Longimicrobium sp.]|nr:hypothetical protein [Longimicrobium sp.]
MALLTCPECGGKVSSAAPACVHCGFPLNAVPAAGTYLGALWMGMPRWLKVLGTLGIAAIAAYLLVPRRNPAPSSTPPAAAGQAPRAIATPVVVPRNRAATVLDSVVIEDWNWRADPEFAGRGTIHVNLRLRNHLSRMVQARVELTSYDADGKLVNAGFTYVNDIPPGETAAEKTYFDYIGTEKRLEARVAQVR